VIGERLYRAMWGDKVAEAGSLVAYLAARHFSFVRTP
jgi:hypothetical protein